MHQDDADQAQDRLRSCLPRTPAEQELAAGAPGPRVPELSALLAEIDSLRLALAADLGMAASAVEVGAFDVARDVVGGGQHDVAGFSLRAEQLLTPREPAAAVPAGTGHEPLDDAAVEADVVPLPRRRRARRLSLLAPALTAAAALVGLLAGVVPTPGGAGVGTAPMTLAAHDSYAELWRLHDGGAPSSHVAQAARDLNSEVARLVALAATDPASAEQALRLLELELELLDDPQHGGALAPERQASQRLLARLRQVLGRTPVGEVLAQAPQPVRKVAPLVPAPVAEQLPQVLAAAPELTPLRPVAPSPAASPTPAAEPTPASQPSSQPSASPQQDEAPEPTPQAEPEPSPSGPGGLLPPQPQGAAGSAPVPGPPGD